MTVPIHPLDAIEEFVQRFVAYPSKSTVVAHVLWIAHCHLIDCFENTPRLAALSPEPGSGKSRLLEVTEPLVPRPVISVNATSAYIFRKISDEAGLPTLLMDEVDAVFGSRSSDASEDLRGLLNSGYRRGAIAGRAAVRGKEVVTEDWPSFCAVAMAGLNQLPDTLMTRSVVINMKRRKPTEYVLPYRRRVYRAEAGALFERIAEWATSVHDKVDGHWPDLPEGIEDRDADVWEPLISVADAAGGSWPERARDAAVTLVNEARNKPATLGIRLLVDIQRVLGNDERISTNELLDRLHQLETAPWANIQGEKIDSRWLARHLTKYQVPTNNTFKMNGVPVKGYQRHHFSDAFARYVPVQSPEVSNPGNPGNGDQPVTNDSVPSVTAVTEVTEIPALHEWQDWRTGRKEAS